MYILFAISVLCSLVLTLKALSIARYVRDSRTSTWRQRDFAQHLFAVAADQGSCRPLPVTQQSVKEDLARIRYQASPVQAYTGNQSISSKPF
jgi:hypothetical protein